MEVRLPTIRPLSDKDFLVVDNYHSEESIKPREKIHKKINLVSQQTDDFPSITDKHLKSQILKDNEATNITTNTPLRKVINLIISIGFLSGATYLFRNFTTVSCSDIRPFNNGHIDNSLWNTPYTFTNQSQSQNRLTGMNSNIINHNHKITKRHANHPYIYYYTENQDKKCKSDKVQKKCKKAHGDLHKKNRIFSRLIINVGKVGCFCPPPDNKQVIITSPYAQHHTKQNSHRHNYIIVNRQKRPEFIPNISKTRSRNEDISTDDITIKKLYDYSCAEESQKTTFSSILKHIGETLAKPITNMSYQLNIYYNYEVLHCGCPSKEDQENLERVTQSIDYIMSNIIQLLPGSKSIAILQNIVSPLLIAASEDIDRKGINAGLFNEAQQNLNFMFQDIIRSSSIKSYSDLSNPGKAIEKLDKKEISESVVSYEDKRLGIWLDERFYDLYHTPDGIPYILENGDTTSVSYDKILQKWQKLQDGEEVIYSADNIKNINRYGIPFKELRESIINDKIEDPDQTEELIYDKEHTQYILTCGKLIAVKIHFVRGDKIFTTASDTLPVKIISRNRFDWFFEQESTRTSGSLTSFIHENMKGETLTKDNLFTNINDDGLSYNPDGKVYLKQKDLYYPAFFHDVEKDWILIRTKYDEEVVLSRDASGFSFKYTTPMPIGVDHEVCGERRLFLNDKDKTLIDKDAYNFLLSHGITQGFDDENIHEVFGGIYTDNLNHHMFMVNDKAFSVSKYSAEDGSIFIKSNTGSDIELYLYNNLIIRKRDRLINEEYTKITKCAFKRDLTDEACSPIFMSEKLKYKLDEFVKKSSPVKINEAGVIQSPDIPGCFIKDNKLYFYHDGFMFKAKVSPFNHQGIDVNVKKVNLFYTTLMRREMIIASFVVDRKTNRIELKEPSMYLAEKTGIEPGEYEFYLKNTKYYAMPNFLTLEHAVNEVNKQGSLQIIDPISKLHPRISDEEIIKMCKRQFFFTLDEPDFTILSLDHVTDDDPLYFIQSKVLTLSNLSQSKHILNIAMEEVDKFTENVEFYLKTILMTKRTDIAKAFASQLHKKLKIVQRNLDLKNIKLVSINRLSSLIHNREDFILFHAGLNEELRQQGTVAFAVLDDTKKIYISVDKLNFIDPEHPDPSMHERPAVDIAETLIHEATHLDGLTTDIYYLDRDGQGKMAPILDEVDFFLKNIQYSSITNLKEIIKINKAYLDKVKIYHNWKDRILSDDFTFQYFSSCETGLLANYYLHNADFMTKIIVDLFQNAFVDRPQLSFLERIGQRVHWG